MKFTHALTSMLLASCLGSGCTSTPPAVKDSAAGTAALMRQVAPEVEKFRTAVQIGDANTAATVASLRMNDEVSRTWLNQHVRFDGAAGNTKRLDLYMQMKAVSDSLLADDEVLRAEQAQIDADTAALLKPLPAVGAKLSNAVNAVVLLGQDRPAKAQFEEALEAWKAVAAATKENRDKLKKAAAAP
ncbi:hypothetical protein LRH25_20285 [Ideonella azotifigens]|uniref:Uncharacterized protein n=1 Tax=Ideonella azotifigens TaxID=513160 RepID=A0ABP3VBI8_9BURK|nr:hypothetical protein [Ideonella azotifigens]MCD2342669.1 hypothetical protein [Ideonella azotifigens]